MKSVIVSTIDRKRVPIQSNVSSLSPDSARVAKILLFSCFCYSQCQLHFVVSWCRQRLYVCDSVFMSLTCIVWPCLTLTLSRLVHSVIYATLSSMPPPIMMIMALHCRTLLAAFPLWRIFFSCFIHSFAHSFSWFFCSLIHLLSPKTVGSVLFTFIFVHMWMKWMNDSNKIKSKFVCLYTATNGHGQHPSWCCLTLFVPFFSHIPTKLCSITSMLTTCLHLLSIVLFRRLLPLLPFGDRYLVTLSWWLLIVPFIHKFSHSWLF